jgi:hypothetical protein
MADASSQQFIGPNERGAFRKFWPRRSRDILSGGELVLENHYATGRSEFEAPGMTHHMLIIPLRANTRMRFGWVGATFEGPFRTGDQILPRPGSPVIVGSIVSTMRWLSISNPNIWAGCSNTNQTSIRQAWKSVAIFGSRMPHCYRSAG